MSRQAVIETGSFTVKAGLWEQTFIPTTRIPSSGRINNETGKIIWGGKTFPGPEDKVLRPVVDGRVVDFKLLEDLWRHVLGSELGLMEPWNDVHLLLIIPPTWGRDVQAECLRICFERFGLAGVYFGETPVLAALGCAQANAVVVDIGHDGTDVSVVWDGHLVKSASERFHIGAAQVDQVIASALKKDSEIARHFGSNANWNALARQFKETGSLTDDNGNTVQVQAEILSEAAEVYFKDSPGLQHVIMSLVNKMDPEKRPLLLDSIVLTGLGCQLRGLSSTFTSALTSILPVSGFPGDHQSNKITLRHVPEYYPEVWQAAGPVCAWFGAGITAKMVFPDNKAHYTKEEYVQMGAYGLLTQKPL